MMSIEFHCPHCDKLLKTSDDKSGVSANCPGCGEIVTVPPPNSDLAVVTSTGIDGGNETPVAVSPSGTGERPCPMCGEQNRASARRCEFCGEPLTVTAGTGRFEATPVEIGPIFDKTWLLYRQNFWLCVAVGAVFIVLSAAANNIPSALIQFLMQQRAINQGFAAVLLLLTTVFGWVVNVFLTIGECRLMLRLARGERAQIGDLFGGGSFLLTSLASWFLYTLMTVLGLAVCVVPGVFLMLMFWPYQHLIVDRRLGVLESLDTSRLLTSANLVTGLLLGLLNLGLVVLGFAMCCVGVVLTIPLIMLLNAVAYLMISGQPVVTGPVESN